jgi:NitT/TauT family transport system ATP-binding protein
MSQRPGRIIEEIDVEIGDRDNPMKRRQHPKVGDYVVRLMNLLHVEQAAA